mmetsp:Transcript_36861/g.56425  ORF Transcript_36861/g.56425 Transcript_36861/m.56425 type:complete len:259 (+) Transcript_36861:550-1326(+)
MCRNDKKLLQYQLELELYGDVQPLELDPELVSNYTSQKEQFDKDWSVYIQENETYTEDMKTYKEQLTLYNSQQEDKEEAKESISPNATEEAGEETAEAKSEEENQDKEEEIPEPVRPKSPKKPVEPKKPLPSYYDLQSVGRMYFNLTKPNAPKRWESLIAKTASGASAKKGNMQVWWEMVDKYEEELTKVTPLKDEDDEDSSSKKTKKNKSKDKSKDKSGKKKKTKEVQERGRRRKRRALRRSKDGLTTPSPSFRDTF